MAEELCTAVGTHHVCVGWWYVSQAMCSACASSSWAHAVSLISLLVAVCDFPSWESVSLPEIHPQVGQLPTTPAREACRLRPLSLGKAAGVMGEPFHQDAGTYGDHEAGNVGELLSGSEI